MWTMILEKYRRDGFVSLCVAGGPYILERCRRFGRRLYGSVQMIRSGERIVRHNGVAINLNEPALTEEVRQNILRDAYEHEELKIYDAYFKGRSEDIVELGAGIGYISCFIDLITADTAEQVVYEANEDLIPTLKRIRALNGAEFEIINEAYSPAGNDIKFYPKPNLAYGSTHEARQSADGVTVSSASLSDIVSEHGLSEFLLCCDIEGAEYELIDEELDVLVEHCPLIVVEFHEFTENDAASYERELTENGFELMERRGRVRVFKND